MVKFWRSRGFRSRIKSVAFAAGALGAYHRLRNRTNLTVVMFHRVLPPGSLEWRHSDQEYSLTTETFAECLAFFCRNYNVIDIGHLARAHAGNSYLPDRPLLITFDDGWSDTLRFAAPLLRASGLSAVCFVVAEALDDPEDRWWQDVFTVAWRRRGGAAGEEVAPWTPIGDVADEAMNMAKENEYLLTLTKLQRSPKALRDAVIASCLGGNPPQLPRQIVTSGQAREFPAAGIAVGAHGATHLPLTLSSHPAEELLTARERLEDAMRGTSQPKVTTLSFPHGRYSEDVVRSARATGYQLMFTSVPTLTQLAGQRPSTDLYGRIEIATRDIAGHDGRFLPELLASHLFLRPTKNTVPVPAQ